MPRGTRKGINSIANSLLGTTGDFARRRGFANQSAGEASIASALLNRSKAGEVQDSRRNRARGISLAEAIKTPEGQEFLRDILILGDKATGQGISSLRNSSQQRGFRRDAVPQFTGVPANAETGAPAIEANPSLGNALARLGGVSGNLRSFEQGPLGTSNIQTGELSDPALFDSKVQLNKDKGLKIDSQIGLLDEKIKLTIARTGKINSEAASGLVKGSKAATGASKLQFYADIAELWTNDAGFKRTPIPQFADEENPNGKLFKNLTPEQRQVFIIGQMFEILTATPENQKAAMAGMKLDAKEILEFHDEVLEPENKPWYQKFGEILGLIDEKEAADVAEQGAGAQLAQPPAAGQQALPESAPVTPQATTTGLGDVLSNVLPGPTPGSVPVPEAQGGAPAQPTPFPGIAPAQPAPTVDPRIAPPSPSGPIPALTPNEATEISGASDQELREAALELLRRLDGGADDAITRRQLQGIQREMQTRGLTSGAVR